MSSTPDAGSSSRSAFSVASTKYISQLTPEEKANIDKYKDRGVQDILEDINRINEAHQKKSRLRRFNSKIAKHASWLPGIIDVVTIALTGNVIAGTAVGVLKAVILFAYRIDESYGDLADEIKVLSDGFEYLEIYSRDVKEDDLLYKVLVQVYASMLEFYRAARSILSKPSGKTRMMPFLFAPYKSRFGDIVRNIQTSSRSLQEVALAQTWKGQNLLSADMKLGFTTVEDKISKGFEDQKARECADNLNTAHAEDLLAFIHSDWLQGTCQWFFAGPHPVVKQWMSDSGSNILAITGDVGCGKTVLVSFLDQELRTRELPQHFSGPRIVCSYPCKNVHESQRDGAAVMRNIIVQAMTQDEDVMQYPLQFYKSHGKSMASSFIQLWESFEMAVTHVESAFFVLIDAIDKGEQRTCNRMLQKMEALSKVSPNLRILVTFSKNKKYNLELSSSINSIVLATEVEEDVTTIVDERLRKHSERPGISVETSNYLRDLITQRAAGILLWADMALSKIERTPSTNKNKITKLLDAIPRDIGLVYENMLSEISPDQIAEATKVLQIVVGAFRPVKLQEIQFALAVSSEHRSVAEVQEDMEGNVKEYLETVMGGLIRIKNGEVHLVHGSLREYLVHTSGNESLAGQLAESTACQNGHRYAYSRMSCDLTLSSICITTLGLTDFPAATSPIEFPFHEMLLGDGDSSSGEDTPSLGESSCSATDQQFFDYASQFWPRHFASCCENCEEDLLERSINLTKSYPTASWIEELREARPYGTTHQYWLLNHEINPLLVASYFGHAQVIRRMISEHSSLTSEKPVWDSIALAAYMGNKACLELLLQLHSGYNDDMDFGLRNGSFACRVAAAEGHFETVRYLLSKGADLSYPGTETEWNALAVAVNGLHVDVVKELLPLSDVTIKPCGALFACVQLYDRVTPEQAHRRLQILEMLFTDSRIDWTQKGPTGRTFLSYAAETGFSDAIDLVLKHLDPAIMQSWLADDGDDQGRTPAWHAVNNGYAEFLERLSRCGDLLPQICIRGPELENAVARACRRGVVRCVEVLIQLDPTGQATEMPDECLNTPLNIAALSAAPQIIRLLLATGMVSVNTVNEFGVTPLMHAVATGNPDSVRVLLENGANITKVVRELPNGEIGLIEYAPPFEYQKSALMRELKIWWEKSKART